MDLDPATSSHLGLDPVGVVLGDDLLDGGWHEDVTRLEDQVLALVRLCSGEAHDGAVLIAPLLQLLHTQAASKGLKVAMIPV